MAGLGAYAYRTLGWRRAVVVGELEDAIFDWSQLAGFTAEFCSLGGTIVRQVWVPRGTEDYSGVVARIPRTGVDGFVAATGSRTVSALLTKYPGLRGNVARKLIVGALALDPPLPPRRIAGVLSGSAFLGQLEPGYLADLRRLFPEVKAFAGLAFDQFYYGATAATLQALDRVHGDQSNGQRRLLQALAAVVVRTPSGTVRLDRSREAVGSNFLVRFRSSTQGSLYRRVDGVEHTFGGYFTRDDPPPGETTPLCKHGNPPPWAR
jgi:branched-chain amino acid transport system substrate-binding protein